MVTQLDARGALYANLAVAFDYPESAEDFELLRDSLRVSARQVEPSNGLGSALDAFDAATRELSSATLAPMEEYTYLFARQTPCPLYETAYIPGNQGNMLADIAGFYRAFEMRLADDVHEPVDHLGAQLEFMALLCAKETNAHANNMQEQAEICHAARRAFFSEHLARWALYLLARLEDRARLALYPALGRVLRAVLEIEARELGVELESPGHVAPVAHATTEEEPIECPV
jgi:DMSO reductase family type II enzyme chaperone